MFKIIILAAVKKISRRWMTIEAGNMPATAVRSREQTGGGGDVALWTMGVYDTDEILRTWNGLHVEYEEGKNESGMTHSYLE